MSKRMRPRSDYSNLESYDAELALVRKLLKYSKGYEREIAEKFIEVYERLCDLYQEEFPFYFKNGVDQKKLNELILSLSTNSHLETKISEVLEELEREVRILEENKITAWLILDYELTRQATQKSISVFPTQKPYSFTTQSRPDKVKSTIEKPWCKDGKTYIDRVRDATRKMDKDLRSVIVQGIRRGWSQERMTTIFRNITGAAEYKARRLIRTETMAVYSKVTKEVFLENGIEYVEIIGDAECGGICLDYVGGTIPLREAQLGDDLPPYHPNCACSFCAYTEFLDNSE